MVKEYTARPVAANDPHDSKLRRLFFLKKFLSWGIAVLQVALVSAVQESESAIPPSFWSVCPVSRRPTPLGHPGAPNELPVLYSGFPLAGYSTHRNICTSMLFSEFIPPSSSPHLPDPFSMSAPLFLPYK